MRRAGWHESVIVPPRMDLPPTLGAADLSAFAADRLQPVSCRPDLRCRGLQDSQNTAHRPFLQPPCSAGRRFPPPPKPTEVWNGAIGNSPRRVPPPTAPRMAQPPNKSSPPGDPPSPLRSSDGPTAAPERNAWPPQSRRSIPRYPSHPTSHTPATPESRPFPITIRPLPSPQARCAARHRSTIAIFGKSPARHNPLLECGKPQFAGKGFPSAAG